MQCNTQSLTIDQNIDVENYNIMNYQQSSIIDNAMSYELSESSVLKKYLPSFTNREKDQQTEGSIILTPENYMLLLSYCESLQKQNANYIDQINHLKQTVKELGDRLITLENMNKRKEKLNQIYTRQQEKSKAIYTNHMSQNLISKRYSYNEKTNQDNRAKSFNKMPSFQMVKTQPHFQKDQRPYFQKYQDCYDGQDRLIIQKQQTKSQTINFDRQLFEIMKKENQLLTNKIKKFYQQYQDLLMKYDNFIMFDKGYNNFRQKPRFNNYHTQDSSPFSKIKLRRYVKATIDKQNFQQNLNCPEEKISGVLLHQKSQNLNIDEINRKVQNLNLNYIKSETSQQFNDYSSNSKAKQSILQEQNIKRNFLRKTQKQINQSDSNFKAYSKQSSASKYHELGHWKSENLLVQNNYVIN